MTIFQDKNGHVEINRPKEDLMPWKVAQAKQNLSELIRAAAREPQYIYNRKRPVAAVIGTETMELFAAWLREREKGQTLSEAFEELQELCAEEEYDFPRVQREDRPDTFSEDPSASA